MNLEFYQKAQTNQDLDRLKGQNWTHPLAKRRRRPLRGSELSTRPPQDLFCRLRG